MECVQEGFRSNRQAIVESFLTVFSVVTCIKVDSKNCLHMFTGTAKPGRLTKKLGFVQICELCRDAV